MSFSSGGSGFSGAAETLAYMIRAYDMATPVFRAFGAEVEAVTKRVQGSLAEMQRAVAAGDRAVTGAADAQAGAMRRVETAQVGAADAAASSAAKQAAAADKASAAYGGQATAARASATAAKEAAATTDLAWGSSSAAITRSGRNILLATAAVGLGSIDMAAKFQANTLRMETQAGATAKGLDKIREGLLKMAGQVGSTPDQLANGMYHVVSSMNAVLPAATRVNQELAIMKVAAEGAQVGHSNLEQTAYALSAAMNALHQNAKDASHTMGALNAIVGAGDMTMQDLIDSFKSGLIPAAQTFGISLNSVGAALAVMGDMGMRGALAGTRLRMAISLLAAPTKQAAGILETLGMSTNQALASTDKMSKLLAAAGVSVTSLSSDLRKPDGLQVALSDLNDHLKSNGLSADAAGAAIDRAFGGGRMGAAIKLMAENTDRLNLKFQQIRDSSNKFGHDWQLTQETFRVQIDKALAALEALGIALGEKLLPIATRALHGFEDMAGWLVKNKTALELLGGAVITFSTVAVGSYLFSKLTGAIRLMREFGQGLAGAGQWLMRSGGGVTGAAVPGPTGGPSALSSMTSGLFGYSGSNIRVGTMMNPMAVVVSGMGAASGAANATEASMQRAAGIGPAAQAEQGAMARSILASEDQMAAQSVTIERQLGMMAESGTAMEGAMAKVGTQMSLLETTALKTPTGVATRAEQMSLGGIGTTSGASASRYVIPRTELTSSPGPLSSGGTAAELMGGGGLLAGLRSGISALFGNLLRGGMIAGLGALASQFVGGAIGGNAGHTVSHIGTTTAIGAGIGTVIEPGIGTAIGALGGAIVGGITTLFKSQDYAHKLQSAMSPGFGGGPDSVFHKQLTSLLNDYNKQLAGKPESGSAVGSMQQALMAAGAPFSVITEAATAAIKGKAALEALAKEYPQYAKQLLGILPASQLTKAADDAHKAGLLVAQKLEKGWSAYKFQSEPIMFTQLLAEVRSLPAPMQAAAAESAIAFAQKLSQEGKLPARAADQMLAQIEQQFPGLTKFMGKSAKDAVAAFHINFDLKQTEQDINTTLHKMAHDFPQVDAAIKNTAGTFADKSAAVVTSLKSIINGPDSTAAMRKQAKQDLDALVSTTDQDFNHLSNTVHNNMVSAKNAVSSNTHFAFAAGSANFKALAQNIGSYIGSGAEATGKGLQNITDQVNAALKGMGAGHLPPTVIKALSPSQLAGLITGQVSPGAVGDVGGGNLGHETGGMLHARTGLRVPGSVGPDNWTLLDPGGTPRARVGGGELIIANRHTEADISKATMAVYGRSAGQMATGESRVHTRSYATGGILGNSTGGYATGGYVFPFGPGAAWGRTDQGVDFSGAGPIGAIGPSRVTYSNPSDGWYSPAPAFMVYQLLAGADAGKYVYIAEHIANMARAGTTARAGQAIATMTGGIEMGWAAGPQGHQIVMPMGANHLTAAGSSFDAFLHGLTHGVITGGAFGGMAPTVQAPKVSGGGAMGTLVGGVMKKAAAAANAYLAKKMPAGLGSASGGFGVPSIAQGSVERMIFEAGTKLGLGKTGVAGLIGNAFQESSLNPNLNVAGGRGLFSWNPATNPNASKVVLGNVAEQVAQALSETTGGIAGFNKASTSPANAAMYFEQNFEHAGTPNMANRISAANAAFGAGYETGGLVPSQGSPPPPGGAGKLAHAAGSMLSNSEISTFWDYVRWARGRLGSKGAFPSGHQNPGPLSFLGFGAPYGDRPYTIGDHIYETINGVRWANDKHSAYNPWARQAFVHETAHTMQSAATKSSVPAREGGAEAWAEWWSSKIGLAPYVAGGDYGTWRNQAWNRGKPWVMAGQFGAGYNNSTSTPYATGGALAAGGVLPHFATSGSTSSSSHTSKPKVPKVKVPKIHAPQLKLPAGLSPQVDAINSMAKQVDDLSNWYGYLQALYGDPSSAQVTLTNSSGVDVLNWGQQGANIPLTAKTGMVDPSTSRTTKGIWDWVRDIGTPPAADSGMPTPMTFLGVLERELNLENLISADATAVVPHLAALTDIDQGAVEWLNHALDPVFPAKKMTVPKLEEVLQGRVRVGTKPGKWGTWGSAPQNFAQFIKGPPSVPITEPLAKFVEAKVDELKDMVATVKRVTKLKEKLPQAKSDQIAAITARFTRYRSQASIGSATSSFNASTWLRGALSDLSAEERTMLGQIPTTAPADWTGTKRGWATHRGLEETAVHDQISARRTALEQTAARNRFQGMVSGIRARTDLSLEEAADKHAVDDKYSTKSRSYTDQLRTDGRTASQDKTYLTSIRTQLNKQLTQLQNVGDLSQYTDPMGSWNTGRLELQNISIPGLLDDLSQLTGAKLPTTAANAAGTNPMTGTVGFVYQGQQFVAGQGPMGITETGGMVRMPPYGGSFATGGIVPGAPGEPITVIAHGGEGVGAPIDAAGLHRALAALTEALGSHEHAVRGLTRATTAVTNATVHGASVRYDHASLSSDETANLTVGS